MRKLFIWISLLLPTSQALAVMNGELVVTQDPIAHTTVQVRTLIGDHQIGFCSGSIISKDLVLTAAHCLTSTAENISVVFNAPVGSWRLEFPILGFLRHDGYASHESTVEKADQDKSNEEDEQLGDIDDIALIRLKEPLPEGFYPIELIPKALKIEQDTELKIAGYGVSKSFSDPRYPGFPAEDLLSANVPFLRYHDENEIEIAPLDGKTACVGDSGGPLVARIKGNSYLVGELSLVTYLCDGRAIYTRVDQYLDWIDGASKLLHKLNP
jgi:hypothetical protein